jgi:hypothetical protein
MLVFNLSPPAPLVTARRLRFYPLGEQVGCDHRANARLRRTPRSVQDIAALVRFKFPQLSRSNDRACNIEFTAHWANNGYDGNCRLDLFRNGTADGAVHILARCLRGAAVPARRSTYCRARSASARGPTFTPRCLGIKKLPGYAAGARPCQSVNSSNLEPSNLKPLRRWLKLSRLRARSLTRPVSLKSRRKL